MTDHDFIRISPRVYSDYKKTIAKHPPETAAILGGRLETPNFITEFKFCPPQKKDGVYESSGSHVSIDADLMNWIILNEWQANGIYVLGFWHSHPAGVTSPSGLGGDIGFFQNCLQSEDAKNMGWKRVIAPITTFDSNDQDTIHSWVYDCGKKSPTQIPLVVHHQGQDYFPSEFEAICNAAATQIDPPQFSRIDEAENLVRDLALAARRLQITPEISIFERLRMKRRFSKFAHLEINNFMRQMAE